MSKKKFLYILLFLLNGCVGWDEYPDNPDTPERPDKPALFTRIALDLITSPWGDANMIAQHHFFCDPQNGQPNYNFKPMPLNYTHLQYVKEWEELMQQSDSIEGNIGQAFGKFFRARFFFTYSRYLGDIPMYDALQADSGLFSPQYDTQKQIMLQVLTWLEEANAIFNQYQGTKLKIEGDPFFDGKIANWQKVVNSWSIRILINLQKKWQDRDLQLSERFRQVVAHPEKFPFISTYEENMFIRWPGNSSYKYPLYFSGVYTEIQQRRFPLSSTFIDLLRKNQDPRLPVIALPTDSARTHSTTDCKYDYNAYQGANVGLLKEDLYELVNSGKVSYFNPDRYYSPQGEPTIIIGAAEMMFCLAEAVNRGILTGDAREYYEKGIRLSFESYGLSTSDDTFNLYQQHTLYKGDNPDGLRQILEQKYIAFFQHSGYEAFFDQRRTQIPTFCVGPQNLNNQQIPKRWRYPESEYQTNRQHVLEAVNRQYQGVDDINAKMWIIL